MHVKGSIFPPRCFFVLVDEGRESLREEETDLDMKEVERRQHDESHMEKWYFEYILVK